MLRQRGGEVYALAWLCGWAAARGAVLGGQAAERRPTSCRRRAYPGGGCFRRRGWA